MMTHHIVQEQLKVKSGYNEIAMCKTKVKDFRWIENQIANVESKIEKVGQESKELFLFIQTCAFFPEIPRFVLCQNRCFHSSKN